MRFSARERIWSVCQSLGWNEMVSSFPPCIVECHAHYLQAIHWTHPRATHSREINLSRSLAKTSNQKQCHHSHKHHLWYSSQAEFHRMVFPKRNFPSFLGRVCDIDPFQRFWPWSNTSEVLYCRDPSAYDYICGPMRLLQALSELKLTMGNPSVVQVSWSGRKGDAEARLWFEHIA